MLSLCSHHLITNSFYPGPIDSFAGLEVDQHQVIVGTAGHKAEGGCVQVQVQVQVQVRVHIPVLFSHKSPSHSPGVSKHLKLVLTP